MGVSECVCTQMKQGITGGNKLPAGVVTTAGDTTVAFTKCYTHSEAKINTMKVSINDGQEQGRKMSGVIHCIEQRPMGGMTSSALSPCTHTIAPASHFDPGATDEETGRKKNRLSA